MNQIQIPFHSNIPNKEAEQEFIQNIINSIIHYIQDDIDNNPDSPLGDCFAKLQYISYFFEPKRELGTLTIVFDLGEAFDWYINEIPKSPEYYDLENNTIEEEAFKSIRLAADEASVLLSRICNNYLETPAPYTFDDYNITRNAFIFNHHFNGL